MIDAKIQPVTRAEALALITTRGRMTRHDYMTATGLSRGSADQMFGCIAVSRPDRAMRPRARPGWQMVAHSVPRDRRCSSVFDYAAWCAA